MTLGMGNPVGLTAYAHRAMIQQKRLVLVFGAPRLVFRV
jgi:hypothetical protein